MLKLFTVHFIHFFTWGAVLLASENGLFHSLQPGTYEYEEVRNEILEGNVSSEAVCSDIDMHEILPGLFLGSQEAAYLLSSDHGITHILSCRSMVIEPPQLHMAWKQIIVRDESEDRLYPFFEEVFDFIESANGAVLVHCRMGISRSSSLVIAYIMRKFEVPYEAAHQYVRLKRPIIDPYSKFIEDLREYEQDLQKVNCGQDDSNIHQVASTRT